MKHSRDRGLLHCYLDIKCNNEAVHCRAVAGFGRDAGMTTTTWQTMISSRIIRDGCLPTAVGRMRYNRSDKINTQHHFDYSVIGALNKVAIADPTTKQWEQRKPTCGWVLSNSNLAIISSSSKPTIVWWTINLLDDKWERHRVYVMKCWGANESYHSRSSTETKETMNKYQQQALLSKDYSHSYLWFLF